MRINTGQSFSLFNQSGEWEANVDNINKGIVEFSIVKKLRREVWTVRLPKFVVHTSTKI